MGASSSRRLGCWRKISLATVHSWRISVSMSWTCLPGPGLPWRNSNSLLITSSSTAGSMSPCPCCAIQISDTRSSARLLQRVSKKTHPTQASDKRKNMKQTKRTHLCCFTDFSCFSFSFSLIFSYRLLSSSFSSFFLKKFGLCGWVNWVCFGKREDWGCDWFLFLFFVS